jgi:hypothetical protein
VSLINLLVNLKMRCIENILKMYLYYFSLENNQPMHFLTKYLVIYIYVY